MKKLVVGVCAGVVLLALGGCVAGSGEAGVAAAGGPIAQFCLGLWHGIIAPITLLAEVVNWLLPHVLPWKPRMFEAGAGVPYDIGFFITATGGLHFVFYARRRRYR